MNEKENEKLRMNAVTLVDEAGKVRITVSTSDDGTPYIAILSPTGEINALFSVTPDREPYISRTK